MTNKITGYPEPDPLFMWWVPPSAPHEQPLLVFKPWLDAGILHGMVGQGYDFVGNGESEIARLGRTCGFSELAVPAQCHGSDLLDLRTTKALGYFRSSFGTLFRPTAGDAIATESDREIGIGVYTADCLPIIVRIGSTWCCIHAGWKGLANGIIEKTLVALQLPLAGAEAVIFACAGPDAYEVGDEVIEQVGPTANSRASTEGRHLLDLAGTAVNQLKSLDSQLSIYSASVCTIRTAPLHSYRRDGSASGRNLTFVAPTASVSDLTT
jgi:copper oxidase (laccase) domain-containing protein